VAQKPDVIGREEILPIPDILSKGKMEPNARNVTFAAIELLRLWFQQLDHQYPFNHCKQPTTGFK